MSLNMALKYQLPNCAVYWSSHGTVHAAEVADEFVIETCALSPALLSHSSWIYNVLWTRYKLYAILDRTSNIYPSVLQERKKKARILLVRSMQSQCLLHLITNTQLNLCNFLSCTVANKYQNSSTRTRVAGCYVFFAADKNNWVSLLFSLLTAAQREMGGDR